MATRASADIVRTGLRSSGWAYRRWLSTGTETGTESGPLLIGCSKKTNIIGTWMPTDDPRVAQQRLVKLRKHYELQVKQLRKKCFGEYQAMVKRESLHRQEEKDRILAAKEARENAKKERSQITASQRQKQQEDFRQMLNQRRREKAQLRLEREHALEERKMQEKEKIRQKSSLWIDEKDLDDKIIEALVNNADL